MSISPLIDEMLGGLQPGRLVEFCGLSGTGKTALTIQAIANLLVKDPVAEVIIFDNHGFFPSSRLAQMLQGRLPEDQIMGALERVKICYELELGDFIRSFEYFMAGLDGMLPVKLVVLDNISYYFRHFRSEEVKERVRLIKYVGMMLRRFSRMHQVPVIVNNHLTATYLLHDNPESGTRFTPFLGDTWTGLIDYRVTLSLVERWSNRRRASLTKTTTVPKGAVTGEFAIEVLYFLILALNPI